MSTSNTILDAANIDRILSELTGNIIDKNDTLEKLVLIGIHTRGVYLAGRLQTKIKKTSGVDLPTGTMDITLYRDDWTRITQNPVVRKTDIPFAVDEKIIILVDDVLFTGRTIRAALDAIIDFGRPGRIELAVLIDRGHREVPIQADYVGITIDTKPSDRINVLLSEHDGEDKVFLE
ncbi:MAG: bifunctional pyr operon transcriptional regulator/uracil phosphoribosyltransferase PyrR [Desulfobacterales bacterium]|nr:bifunctional pyr operon transcriptional regulator/uracil phosphoribosyltransferase PyrR [Desulfobacterales bacterium]